MERDKRAVLILRAHSVGLVDYIKWVPDNPECMLREHVVCRELENGVSRELLKLRHNRLCAELTLIAGAEKKADLYKQIVTGLDEIEYYLGTIESPWIERRKPSDGVTLRQSEIEEMSRAWEAKFGKMDSLENKALFNTLAANQSDMQGVSLIEHH